MRSYECLCTWAASAGPSGGGSVWRCRPGEGSRPPQGSRWGCRVPGCPVHCRVFSCIPGFTPAEPRAPTTGIETAREVSGHRQTSCGEGSCNYPLLRPSRLYLGHAGEQRERREGHRGLPRPSQVLLCSSAGRWGQPASLGRASCPISPMGSSAAGWCPWPGPHSHSLPHRREVGRCCGAEGFICLSFRISGMFG